MRGRVNLRYVQRASRSFLGILDAPMYGDGWARLWRRAGLVLAEFIGLRAEPPRCALSPLVSTSSRFRPAWGKLPGGLIHPRIATSEQWRAPNSRRQRP